MDFLHLNPTFVLMFLPKLCINTHPSEAPLMKYVYFLMRNLSQEQISAATADSLLSGAIMAFKLQRASRQTC